MAKKVRTWLTDDKEAAAGRDVEADQTVEFGLDGNNYEIDLCVKNATKLRNDIEQWIEHARKVNTQRKRASGTMSTRPTQVMGEGASDMDAEQRKACRAWLRNNGYPNLSDRGRIPADGLVKFHERAAVA